jgi:D-xylose 1-dehydrogenase
VEPGEKFASYPSLRDHVVIVTGGASGIGESIVEAFAKQGAKVAFFDIQEDAAHKLLPKIKATDGTIPEFHRCDVTNTEALQACIEEILGAHGMIDILVNIAATGTKQS